MNDIGGAFVLKTYDITSSFTAGILYLLYQSFDKVTIVKPWTSRSTNSERFIVCKGFLRPGCEPVITHLCQVNEQMNRLFETLLPDYTQTLPEYIFFGRHVKQSHSTVDEIVPLEVMSEDEDFMEYLQMSNMRYAFIGLLASQKPSHSSSRKARRRANQCHHRSLGICKRWEEARVWPKFNSSQVHWEMGSCKWTQLSSCERKGWADAFCTDRPICFCWASGNEFRVVNSIYLGFLPVSTIKDSHFHMSQSQQRFWY